MLFCCSCFGCCCRSSDGPGQEGGEGDANNPGQVLDGVFNDAADDGGYGSADSDNIAAIQVAAAGPAMVLQGNSGAGGGRM